MKYFMKTQKLNRRQAYQVLYLLRFNSTLEHVSDIKIGKVGTENNNENQKLIKEEWIRGIIEVVVEGPEMMLVEKRKRTKEKDKEVVKIVKEMKKARVKALRENEWEIEKELVLKEEKVYILKDEELRLKVI